MVLRQARCLRVLSVRVRVWCQYLKPGFDGKKIIERWSQERNGVNLNNREKYRVPLKKKGEEDPHKICRRIRE